VFGTKPITFDGVFIGLQASGSDFARYVIGPLSPAMRKLTARRRLASIGSPGSRTKASEAGSLTAYLPGSTVTAFAPPNVTGALVLAITALPLA
jgi:hypothetical protein